MAVASRQSSADLVARLLQSPQKFEFQQAMRLLERIARLSPEPGATPRSVGEDARPSEEIVRFRTLPSLVFPASSIHTLNRPELKFLEADRPTYEMVVTFFGLFGSTGALPQHYTSLVVERCKARDFSLRDFLDLLNHRSVSLFYRAVEKYRLPLRYERRNLDVRQRGPDQVTYALLSLVGVATPGLQRRLAVDDEALIYYSGFYSHQPRAAVSLERLLGDYFRLPIQLEQFIGRWQYLAEAQRSRVAGRHHPEAQNREMARNVIVGRRYWDVQSKFRIRVGPMRYETFREFLPTGRALKQITHLARLYAGDELEFEVQAVLLADEVPRSRLTRKSPSPSRLGWNSWVHARPARHDADQAKFKSDRLRGKPVTV